MRFLAALGLTLFLAACGGEGALGESCDTPAGEGECEAGSICTNMTGGDNVCRKVCADQSQCSAGENCNGVSGSSTKSCQPQSAT
jgi:hypothetical protein